MLVMMRCEAQQQLKRTGMLMCKSGHPESNKGSSGSCTALQSDTLPTEL